jgi:ABC-type nitrate/sulfonate/bicarbonate transport system ATPase subunit
MTPQMKKILLICLIAMVVIIGNSLGTGLMWHQSKLKQLGGKNHVTAIDHMDFCIDDREFVTIMGQSGSGKSTLLFTMLRWKRLLPGLFGSRMAIPTPDGAYWSLVFKNCSLSLKKVSTKLMCSFMTV